jgi:hypothetical protein
MKRIVNRILFLVNSKIREILGQSHSTQEIPYLEYLALQKAKTEDLERRKRWLGPEYELKIVHFKIHFKEIFPKLISTNESILCVCARTGQEVVALKELGYENSIGVDLVP